jgi:hypothetical protein
MRILSGFTGCQEAQQRNQTGNIQQSRGWRNESCRNNAVKLDENNSGPEPCIALVQRSQRGIEGIWRRNGVQVI